MNSLQNRTIVSIILAFSLLAGGASAAYAQSTSSEATLTDLQEQIEQLQQRVQSLAEEVANQQEDLSEQISEEEEDESATTSEESATTSLPEQASDVARIARQLSQGDRGPDVRQLQELLASNSEIYPEGLVTGYFGPLTNQAVTRLQQQVNLPTTGTVGSSTLQQINTLLTEGAGQSGMIPPGLLKAPGLWKTTGEDDDTGTSSAATSTEEEGEEDDNDEDDDEEEEEDEESAEADDDRGNGMPDWNQLPIDSELKNRMNSMFGGQRGNPGQGGR